ncbi:MAG: ribose 5-phosphate isomerase A [Rhodobiaceae bacterium]|jgi:ribose 5-phosphate isomerase A|nr:ribose 5-phosphate isomerase A [Rhodobiaceae bacterium]|tara:strand:- start:5199 stop:5888 length:690 start_codon:yes stop_codon:yes gene_type:complete
MSLEKKIRAAEKALEFVETGMKIGLGSGSTANEFIKLLSLKIKEGFDIEGVVTSQDTENLAKESNIPLTSLQEAKSLDITIDGTDEVDSNLSLIKGGGGALLREKIVAYNSEKLIIIADDSKKVDKLGNFKLPVEVSIYESSATNLNIIRKLEEVGYYGSSSIRKSENTNFITDSGNYIYDFSLGSIEEPYIVDQLLNSIPGVIGHGLFIDLADIVIIANEESVEILSK